MEISCYKTHYYGMDLPYMVMIKHIDVDWNTYKLWTIYLGDTLRENTIG